MAVVVVCAAQLCAIIGGAYVFMGMMSNTANYGNDWLKHDDLDDE